MRLNAYLSQAGVASRRNADKLIKAGQVKVNGRTGQLNDQVTEKDIVEVDSRPVRAQKNRYILLYKPAGVITTTSDPRGRSTVVDLVKAAEKVVPVGRLDQDTTGALLLTNDGQLAYRLTHPKFNFEKTYEVKVKGNVDKKVLDLLSNGVELDDCKTAPARAAKKANGLIELTIHEGRKRQVKRMIKAVGLELVSLHRSGYGSFNLDGLRPGQWRDLSAAEIKQLLGSPRL
jgi:23S rRNA pseudouridine2605 synthase